MVSSSGQIGQISLLALMRLMLCSTSRPSLKVPRILPTSKLLSKESMPRFFLNRSRIGFCRRLWRRLPSTLLQLISLVRMLRSVPSLAHPMLLLHIAWRKSLRTTNCVRKSSLVSPQLTRPKFHQARCVPQEGGRVQGWELEC